MLRMEALTRPLGILQKFCLGALRKFSLPRIFPLPPPSPTAHGGLHPGSARQAHLP